MFQIKVHINVISYATFFVIHISGVVLPVLYVISSVTGWDMRATSTGCRNVNSQEYFQHMPLIFVILTVIFQALLLVLFTYPLCNHYLCSRAKPNRKLLSSDFDQPPGQTLKLSSLHNIQCPNSNVAIEGNGLVDEMEGKNSM